ncbi:MAG: hypothetical protein CBC83_03815 [Flavobacteriales bacterium TMED123]|nr:MAG: hypothetical protein CBC83_03815 [Flavobacteriales bacterium TMED123]|tara:strand:+ start:3929 stop:5140 length:1212 start_codon:yes stop_codon:yes gene_type:complete
MAKVRPFKAIRPTRDKVHLFATRSYLTYSEETLKEKLENNPYTFLHIINPEHKKNKQKKGIKKYKLIKDKFNAFVKSGVLQKEEKKLFYLYRQQTNSHIFEGIIAACCVDDYLDGTIKIHEHTITKREHMFTDYLATTGFNADPVLLAYKENDKIKEVIKKISKHRAEYNFTTTNKVQHQMWLIEEDINLITKEFERIDKIYIADGHHRSSSSALLAKRRNADKQANSNYFMSYLIDESQLNIINFNRLVCGLNGKSSAEFLTKIDQNFSIVKKGDAIYSPSKKDEIGMYFEKNWYSLTLKQNKFNSVVDSLDPSILSENILKPILNIQDEKTDKNITFFDGTLDFEELKMKVDSEEFTVAFILKPIPIEALKKVADNNEIMPPKSTYIKPKLRSGLTIYTIE